jgi:hypothetical protein
MMKLPVRVGKRKGREMPPNRSLVSRDKSRGAQGQTSNSDKSRAGNQHRISNLEHWEWKFKDEDEDENEWGKQRMVLLWQKR